MDNGCISLDQHLSLYLLAFASEPKRRESQPRILSPCHLRAIVAVHHEIVAGGQFAVRADELEPELVEARKHSGDVGDTIAGRVAGGGAQPMDKPGLAGLKPGMYSQDPEPAEPGLSMPPPDAHIRQQLWRCV